MKECYKNMKTCDMKSCERHMKSEKKSEKKKKDPKQKTKSSGKAKIKRVMDEFKEGKLHSGSKNGPIVTNPKQGIAIAISESKRKKRK